MKYESYTPEQLNGFLPSDSNWTILRLDGYDTNKQSVKNLMVIAKCICGQEYRKQWSRLQAGRFYSCGCTARNDKVPDLEGEIWKSVVGYEGIYEVSNLGRIKRINKIKITKVGSQLFFKEKLRSMHFSDKGYMRCILTNKDVKCAIVGAHVVVAQAFIPNPQNLPEVNHIDTIKHHNWVENLEWCTHQDNMTHAKENGLLKIGEDAYHAILNETQVLEIRKKYKKHEYTMSMIAEEYGVSRGAIQQIIERRNWKHV